MIWLAWRQFRLSAVTTTALVLVSAIVLAKTGIDIARLAHAEGAGSCAPPACFADSFTRRYRVLQHAHDALLVMPALIGVFWGAPAGARDLETGDYRLPWTQSISRRRWLATTIVVLAGVTIAVTAVATLGLTWWYRPFAQVSGHRFAGTTFAETGIVPVAYSVLALAAGVLAGVAIRRTVPAMLVTLCAFATVRFAVTELRPHFMAPVRAIVATGSDVGLGQNDWLYSTSYVDRAGRPVVPDFVCSIPPDKMVHATGALAQAQNKQCNAESLHYYAQLRTLVTYQPAHRYWAFQFIEAGIFAGAAIALAATAVWLIRRVLT